MGRMGPLPAGNPSMAQGQASRFPRQGYKPFIRSPQPHTTYNMAPKGRKLKQRGRAIIDANPYKTSLQALQRGTNIPIRLIGGEVRGHGASKYSRQRKRQQELDEMKQRALENADKGAGEVKNKQERDDDKWREFFPMVGDKRSGLARLRLEDQMEKMNSWQRREFLKKWNKENRSQGSARNTTGDAPESNFAV